MPVTPPQSQNFLIYDEECFFCSNYVRLLDIKAALDGIVLINARDKKAVEAFHLQPADLNKGMVLVMGNTRYAGADAIHFLALLSTTGTGFNRINSYIFKRAWMARLLYPLLKLGRRTYLLLAGKSQIH